MIRRALIGTLSLACSLQWLGTAALADDASVLPRGVFRLSSEGLYREKTFPLPAVVILSCRNRFAGSDNAPRNQYIGLEPQVFF